MITPKTNDEIAFMREGGRKLWSILQKLLDMSNAGVLLTRIEETAQEEIRKAGGTPSFPSVKGYQWATCLCINEQVVHGIPTSYALGDQDILTIDIGMIYKGFHTDCAWTKIIRRQTSDIRHQTKYEDEEKFLRVGEEALEKAIREAVAGNRVGHISRAIEASIAGAGYSVVRSLTGHGVGKTLHEEPLIPEYQDRPMERTPLLTVGMTLAIEVIYAKGKGAIEYQNDDGWTLATKDRSASAVFERTIAVGTQAPVLLTAP